MERDTSIDRDQAQPAETESVDSIMRAVAHVPSLASNDLAAAIPNASVQASERLPGVGEIVGERYLLTSVLGRGGMGAVYAARNLGTGREVAIKVLLPEARSESERLERVARFVREARAAGRVRHPNVVDVYDVDSKHGLPHLVMERLHGESLGECLRRGPLPLSEAVRVLLAAMRGVAEAHRQGVIHRDLKPDNIFLARVTGESEPVAKVLDFGVSRIVLTEEGEAKGTTLTRTGHLLGTFEYMPLEQLRGAAHVDARADVYALGVILYEAIAGVRPYEAANDRDLSVRLATEAALPLSMHVPGLAPALVSAVARALQRDPGDRYPSVESFASELAAACATSQVVAHGTTARGRFTGGRRSALWLGIALTLALVSALVAWRLPTRKSGVVLPVETAARNEAPPPLPYVQPQLVVSPASASPAPVAQPVNSRVTNTARPPFAARSVDPSRGAGGGHEVDGKETRKSARKAESKVRSSPAPKRESEPADRPTQLLKTDF